MAVSKRFQSRAGRPVNQDSYIQEWPETGLVIFQSPADPKPQIRVEDGRIVELDGKPEAEFDMIDRFIARYAIDVSIAAEAMAMDSLAIARTLVDLHTPRQEVVRIISGLTPARVVEVVNHLNVVEMMQALQKMRARKTPSNQAHVTNRKENPALLAADAAEAVERGFAELETTVGVARYAPLNALAILIGSQTGRGTALTQCAVEEALGLKLALLGLTTYAETLSVYGTEQAFHDGDDTPWSKAFLASAYASRGIKVRFTSGSGSEALMGHSEGKSMLYLETRCLIATKGAGSQGAQNGSISCIALPEALPGGVRGVLAENLIAAMLDLEVASGNDAMPSHTALRHPQDGQAHAAVPSRHGLHLFRLQLHAERGQPVRRWQFRRRGSRRLQHSAARHAGGRWGAPSERVRGSRGAQARGESHAGRVPRAGFAAD
jgi:propanediol dehydratase large subunit